MDGRKQLAPLAALLLAAGVADAEGLAVQMHKLTTGGDGLGDPLGVVRIEPAQQGVLIKPDLDGLDPGLHGFHLHANPSCAPAEKDGELTAGAAAGGHFDPQNTGKHEGPYGEGHIGDLPALYVDETGEANLPVLAPRLRVQDFSGHALIVHAGGDNYSDVPKPLGGGGARVACGVVSEYARLRSD